MRRLGKRIVIGVAEVGEMRGSGWDSAPLDKAS
jgi:hypothetical protein